MNKLPSVSIMLLGLASYFMAPCDHKLRPFTLNELLEWAPGLGNIRAARTNCVLLSKTGLIAPVWATPEQGRLNQNASNPPHWELTQTGYEAVRAARLEVASQARSKALLRSNKERDYSEALSTRLWNIFLIRRMVTCSDAADTLANAGDDMVKLRKRIGTCLREWHKRDPEHVKRSTRRIEGRYRYVLEGKVNRHPPAAPHNPVKGA